MSLIDSTCISISRFKVCDYWRLAASKRDKLERLEQDRVRDIFREELPLRISSELVEGRSELIRGLGTTPRNLS